MEKFGCTTPFGQYLAFGHQNILENICTDNKTGKQALELFDTLSPERHFISDANLSKLH